MTTFDKHKDCWDRLSREDPLWAILSRDDKQGGRWQLEDFLRTGHTDVSTYLQLFGTANGRPKQFAHILDFGCGVGRLTLAWKEYANRVTGVDISETMIHQAQHLASGIPEVSYVWNPKPDLSCFADSSFDLVFSHICLQHMPWSMARDYLREFSRLCRPGGYIAFQLPSASTLNLFFATLRRWLIDHLPLGLDRIYRKWRRGTSTLFGMHFTSAKVVIYTGRSFGLNDLWLKYDESAGAQTEGFIYLFQKPVVNCVGGRP